MLVEYRPLHRPLTLLLKEMFFITTPQFEKCRFLISASNFLTIWCACKHREPSLSSWFVGWTNGFMVSTVLPTLIWVRPASVGHSTCPAPYMCSHFWYLTSIDKGWYITTEVMHLHHIPYLDHHRELSICYSETPLALHAKSPSHDFMNFSRSVVAIFSPTWTRVWLKQLMSTGFEYKIFRCLIAVLLIDSWPLAALSRESGGMEKCLQGGPYFACWGNFFPFMGFVTRRSHINCWWAFHSKTNCKIFRALATWVVASKMILSSLLFDFFF